MKCPYRIKKANGRFLNAGTDKNSWFDLETARDTVNRDKGEKIIQSNGVDELWEVF